MTIHFKSTYGSSTHPQVVEFYAPLVISKYQDLQVLDFEEKRTTSSSTAGRGAQILKTKIEYNATRVAIYSGISTLEMEKGQIVENLYLNDVFTNAIYVLLNEVIIRPQGVVFRYDVATNAQMEDPQHFELDLNFLND